VLCGASAVLACFYLLFAGLVVSVLVSIWVGMSFQWVFLLQALRKREAPLC
jgi:hypothetical protein